MQENNCPKLQQISIYLNLRKTQPSFFKSQRQHVDCTNARANAPLKRTHRSSITLVPLPASFQRAPPRTRRRCAGRRTWPTPTTTSFASSCRWRRSGRSTPGRRCTSPKRRPEDWRRRSGRRRRREPGRSGNCKEMLLPGNTLGGSITVLLTSCLTGLD